MINLFAKYTQKDFIGGFGSEFATHVCVCVCECVWKAIKYKKSFWD